jgi:hypothetical protein
MFLAKFSRFKIAGAADRNGTGVTEKSSTALALFVSRAPDFRNLHQLAFNEAAIDEIKGQCLEADVSGHLSPGVSGSTGVAAGTALNGAHHVLAGDDAHKPLIAIDNRHAADAMVDHQLKHPGQPGIRPDIDEFGRYDVGDGAPHQVVVVRHHVRRGKDEAGKMVEFRNQPNHLPSFFDRIGVKILAFKEVAEFAQRQAAFYRLDVARHMVSNDLFDKAFQDVTLN